MLIGITRDIQDRYEKRSSTETPLDLRRCIVFIPSEIGLDVVETNRWHQQINAGNNNNTTTTNSNNVYTVQQSGY